MTAAGWDVTVQPFQFQTFVSLAPSVLEQVSPAPVGPIVNTILSYSGSGDVTAGVTALQPNPADPTPGCEAADFAGFPAGNIALIQRGGCTFAIKATNADAAGATGVVIYNNAAGDINGTLGNAFTLNIPVVSVTQAIGQQLAATAGLVLRVKTDTLRGFATTYNVLAELPGKNAGNVVMAGAHLDSVNAGPGINDNGSGSAALLEVGQQLGKVKPQNTVRLAWWGAEESNLVGSTYYVNNLSQAELDKIALYLNFDMIGSPNHVVFIYDGDDSDAVGAGPGPAGSAQIEKTFEAFFTSRGIPFKGTDFSGRSDYGPFIAAGIPSGGLFTGAEGIKTAEEAALWGGTAGVAYDHCYHQACDTYLNNNEYALETNSDAVAYATLNYAMSTALINGTKSKGNFRPPADQHARQPCRNHHPGMNLGPGHASRVRDQVLTSAGSASIGHCAASTQSVIVVILHRLTALLGAAYQRRAQRARRRPPHRAGPTFGELNPHHRGAGELRIGVTLTPIHRHQQSAVALERVRQGRITIHGLSIP